MYGQVQKVLKLVPGVDKERAVIVLEFYREDVQRTIDAFIEG